MAGISGLGILGAGWAGEGHVAAYSRLPGVEVTGLWSRTTTRAESLAGKVGCADLTVYDDWQSLIGAGNCDVISIATAAMMRSDPLLAALDQGGHREQACRMPMGKYWSAPAPGTGVPLRALMAEPRLVSGRTRSDHRHTVLK